MAHSYVPFAAGVVNFVILVAALSAMNSQLYITTRMMFSLARAGFAQRRFGVLSSRGTPVQRLCFPPSVLRSPPCLTSFFPELPSHS